jgi:hypothetical protein
MMWRAPGSPGEVRLWQVTSMDGADRPFLHVAAVRVDSGP